MSVDAKDYLGRLGMGEVLQERVQYLVDLYAQFGGEAIEDVFVSDRLDEEGVRQFEAVWLFSENHVMEASLSDPVSMDSVRIGNVIRWAVQHESYDWKNAIDASRLNVEFRLDIELNGVLRATRENCDVLRDIFFKYVIPRA